MRALTSHPFGKKVGGLVGWIGLSVPNKPPQMVVVLFF